MPKRGPVWLVLGVALAGSVGCGLSNDLGAYCILVRADPADTNPADGISSIPVTQGELPIVSDPTAKKDFISFGSTECEDLVCVRDSNFAEANESGLSVGPDFPAYGVCSASCVANNQTTCKAADSAIDKDARTHLSCREIVLDADTLAAIKEADPEKYQQYFGTNTSPFFCARGTDS